MTGDVKPPCAPARIAAALPWCAAVLLLAMFTHLAWRSAAGTGPTHDEPAHLADGYVRLKTGDYSVNPQHPPLAKMWAALPLLSIDGIPPLESLGEDATRSGWTLGVELFFSKGAELANRCMGAARRQMILFGVALGAVIFLWSRQVWGPWGGLFSLSLFAFSPNFIGHSGIIHTDVPVTLGLTLTGFLAWRLAGGKWPAAVLLGIAFGFALGVKFTAVLAIPLLAVWLIAAPLPAKRPKQTARNPEPQGWRLGSRAARLAIVFGIAWIASVAMYGWPPAFGAYLRGMSSVYRDHAEGLEFFLWGYRKPGRFLPYFTAAMLVKTPIATLAAFGVSLFCLRRRNLKAAGALLALAAVFMAAAMALAANIGVRYVFPVYSFLFVFSGILLSPALAWRPLRAAAAIAIVVGAGWAGARSAPNSIAFFNCLAGGAEGGIRYLDDSNLDWGQGVRAAAEYMKEHSAEKLYCAWRTHVEPSHYGAKYDSLNDNLDRIVMPSKGTYVISATLLTLRRVGGVEGLAFDWLARHRPAEILDGTVYIYKFDYAGDREPGFDEAAGVNYIREEDMLRGGIERLRDLNDRHSNPKLSRLEAIGQIRLGAFLQNGGRHREAIPVLTEAAADPAEGIRARAGLVLSYCALEDLDNAWRELVALSELDPYHPDLAILAQHVAVLKREKEQKSNNASAPLP
jgi:hypothetical protein